MTILGNIAFREALQDGRLVIEPRPSDDRIGTSSIDLLLAGEFQRWRKPSAGMELTIDPSATGFSCQTYPRAS
jgi:deoxycytidine triphosphate deaminase